MFHYGNFSELKKSFIKSDKNDKFNLLIAFSLLEVAKFFSA
jgi:hypothetical protein